MYSNILFGVCAFLTFMTIHRVYRVFYDLYYHPLAHIPGPKLAAISYLYQTYYSLVGGSRFYMQIGKLHDKYGPVVRITPDEVHLSDPENYDKIYHVGSPYFKAKRYYESMSAGAAGFATISNEKYQPKRARLKPFFSRMRVLQLEDVVQSKAQQLVDLVAQKFMQNKSMDLRHGYRAVSVDIITDYAFNRCYDLLDSPDIGERYFRMCENLGPAMCIFQQWPIMMSIANAMPQWMAAAMSGPLAHVFQVQEHCRHSMALVKADMDAGKISVARKTIFHDLLTDNPSQGYFVPSTEELTDEATTILGAAADTTGNAMTVATIELTSDPEKYARLTAELRVAFPDENSKLDLLSLEKLPHLTRVIKEGIRLSFGDPGKLSREVPPPGATFNGFYVPPGSYVSMSTWDLHRNEHHFPNAMKFDPDRWADCENVKHMEKAFVPFGKGGRACIGINLTFCEMYVILGNMFRRFDDMIGNDLQPENRVYNDYISARTPAGATKFHVRRRMATEKRQD